MPARSTVKQIRSLVEQQQKKYGWEFIFLGANIDAIAAQLIWATRRRPPTTMPTARAPN
jgi:hypothetical protein